MLQFSSAEVQAPELVPPSELPEIPQPIQNFCTELVVVPSRLVVVMFTRPVTALGGSPPPDRVFEVADESKGLTAYAFASPRFAAQVTLRSIGRLVEKKM